MTNINKSSKKTATSFELKKKDQIIFHIRFLLMTNINKSSKKRATSFELKKRPNQNARLIDEQKCTQNGNTVFNV